MKKELLVRGDEIEQKSPLKLILSLIFIITVVALLLVYWFIPFNTVEFNSGPNHSNFTLNSSNPSQMQFYYNMRYPSSEISYQITDCTLQKQKNMEDAFEIIENLTVLKFSKSTIPQISITCDERNYVEQGMFIAGEGGPSNITKTEIFGVILEGKVLLIRESTCPKPNVAIHELLHALGFDHSNNPNNIMYNFSKCSQTIGEEIPIKINELYSTPTQPDPSIKDASAVMRGKYLDTNISIRNEGLAKSNEMTLEIYADDKRIKEVDIPELDIGYGTMITMQNLWISQLATNILEYKINYQGDELNKNNNKVILEIKE